MARACRILLITMQSFLQAFYLDNEITSTELHDMGIAATRQLAKRQLTWLRGMKTGTVQEFDCLANNLSAHVQHFLQAVLEKN